MWRWKGERRRWRVWGGLLTTITMQSIGHARAHARHPVQISRSTSRIPRWRNGSVSCTRTGIRSGYCTVYGLRMKCEAVTAIPSKIVKTVSFIFCAYSETALIGPLYSRIEVYFHPRTLEIVDNALDEHYRQRDPCSEHYIAHRGVAVGPR